MRKRDLAANLYFGNAVVLIAHEIDSAYWHEWEMFRLPGGIQLFLILNIVLISVVVWGYRTVILWGHGARSYSYLLATLGIFAALIHGAFLAAGTQQFRIPISLALLVAALVLSIGQLIVTTQIHRQMQHHRH